MMDLIVCESLAGRCFAVAFRQQRHACVRVRQHCLMNEEGPSQYIKGR